MDKDTIAIGISAVSLLLTLFGMLKNCKNRKDDLQRAKKIRDEDSCNVEKKLDQLKSHNKSLQKQATLAEKHVNFLLKTKEELDLGPPLLFNINSPTLDKIDPDNGPISIILYIKNPTERIIQMNNIWINKKCPFEFIEVYFASSAFSKYGGKIIIHPTSPKHISLIKPRTTPQIQFDRCGIAPFNISGGEEIKWEIFILPKNLNKAASPLFTLEHTSSNHPQKTIKPIFWTHFIDRFS